MRKNKGNKVTGPHKQISFRLPLDLRRAFVNHVKGRGFEVTNVMRGFVEDYMRQAGLGALPEKSQRSDLEEFVMGKLVAQISIWAVHDIETVRGWDKVFHMPIGTLEKLLESKH